MRYSVTLLFDLISATLDLLSLLLPHTHPCFKSVAFRLITRFEIGSERTYSQSKYNSLNTVMIITLIRYYFLEWQ